MKPIGPHFVDELKAAGLIGLPFSWGADGVTYGSTMTAQQIAAVEAVIAAHDSTLPALPTDEDAAKSYAKLTALRGMTPAQVGAWVDANVTNLAQAQDAIKTLAIAVSVLARRL